MPASLIITPTYQRDLERFALLRESIRRFAPAYSHLAIVHTEDLPKFRARFASDAGLELLATADVLPRLVEQRRRRSRHRWLKGLRRIVYGQWVSGWHFQQLTKLYALAGCASESAAFLDSDVFLCRPITADYFQVGGQTKLLRRRAVTGEQIGFDIATHVLLHNPLQHVTEFYDYVFQPASFRKSTAVRLLQTLRQRSSWVYRFLNEPRPSEYNLLGYSATVLEQCQGYHLVECQPEDFHHRVRYAEDRARMSTEFDLIRQRAKDFVWIQSTLRVDIATIRRVYQQVLEAQGHGGGPSPDAMAA